MSMIPPPPPCIPNDVIVEILSWVSVSSLFRLRWTCKYWFDLITTRDNPAFIKLHLLHHSTDHDQHDINQSIINNSTSLLIFTPNTAVNLKCSWNVLNQSSSSSSSSSPKTVQMDFYNCCHDHKFSFNFSGSCNGLIYFHRFVSRSHIDAYFLWNPSTRELKELPHPPQPPAKNISCVHPKLFTTSTIIHGFGYDHTIDDYKVIRIIYNSAAFNNHVPIDSKVDVYTLGSNSWHTKTETVVPFRGDDYINDESGLFVNGALHWMVELLVPPGGLLKIISFDITKEEHGEIQSPKDFRRNCSKLSVLDGCLCIFHSNNFTVDCAVDVWIMKDYNVKESWTKFFTINYHEIKEASECPHWYGMKPLKYLKDNGILTVYYICYLAAYDTKNNKVRYLQMIEDNPCRFAQDAVTYVETLVSLNSAGMILHPDGSRTTTVETQELE